MNFRDIKILRKQLKLKPSELARLADVSPSYIYQLERGLIRNPGHDQMTRIEEVLIKLKGEEDAKGSEQHEGNSGSDVEGDPALSSKV